MTSTERLIARYATSNARPKREHTVTESNVAATIRPMKATDYTAACAVWTAAGLPVKASGRDTPANIARQLEQYPDTYLVAEIDTRIVGVVLGTHDGRKGWINRLAVHPDAQGHGIGRALVNACDAALRAHSITIVAALIEGENPASAAVFAATGFEELTPIRYFRKPDRPDA
jgi:ribosomal protein S18 acetylase RimI-like enzyme